jgi:hypothetical protein
MQRISDDEEEDQVGTGVARGFSPDLLTGALMGFQLSLLQYHPTHAEVIMLWKTHIENVEPIYKVLHIPSTFKMVEMASQQPAMVSKADECLLFAICHFAVFSMTGGMCRESWPVAGYVDAKISLRDSASSYQRAFSQDHRHVDHASSRPLFSSFSIFL